MRKTNIVFISSGLKNGGAELALERLLRAFLEKKTFSFVVFSLDSVGPVGERMREMGIKVIALNLRRGSLVVALHSFFSQISKLQPSQIHGWMYHGNLFAFLAWIMNPKAKLVFNIRQALHSLRQEKITTRVAILFNALLSRICNLVIYNTKLGIRHHVKLGFARENSLYIANGFDSQNLFFSEAKRNAFRRSLNIHENSSVICILARYDPIKGHDIFLQAAELLLFDCPDTLFLIVGDGLSKDHFFLAPLMSKISDNLIVLNHQDDVCSVLNGVDILTLCSRSEGFPNVLGEGMAVGLNCVATDVGDCVEIMGGCGHVVPVEAPSILATKWQEILSQPRSDFSLKGIKARERIQEHFSEEKFVYSYLQVFQLGRFD